MINTTRKTDDIQ